MRNLLESPEFNKYDIDRLSNQVSRNSGRNEEGIRYKDDHRYEDYKGEKWVDVRSRDKKTLISAILDGLSDANPHYKGIKYTDIANEDDLMDAYRANKRVVDTILTFLGKYMHGHVTVYRGFNLSSTDYRRLRSEYGVRFDHEMLKFLNNRVKKFNSFSVSPFVCKEFAEEVGDGEIPIIIAAEVEPNDISFAFTAYLLGRHSGTSEFELNINNIKDLRGLRIIKDIDKECQKFFNNSETEEQLQKRLDNGEKLEEVFDDVIIKKELDGTYYICRVPSGAVVVKDNKIIVPRCREVEYLGDGIYCVTPLGKSTEYIYNSKTGKSSNEYTIIFHRGYNPDDKLIPVKIKNNEVNLVNKQTCKPVFNGMVKKVSRLPGASWYGSKNIWHTVEFYLVTLPNGMKTLINNQGRVAFRGAQRAFQDIQATSEDKLELQVTDTGNKKKKFVINRDGYAVESFG